MIKEAVKHFITITKHRHIVLRHAMKAGIFWQGLTHDLSKYSFTEFSNGVKYYQASKSPNELERKMKGYSEAWLHHKGRNRHHFEYWLDYDPITKKLSPIEMPNKYLIEMFCDRVAASKNYLKKNYTNRSPLEYFLNSKDRIMMHENTKKTLEILLVMLSEKGEKEVFHYIKKELHK